MATAPSTPAPAGPAPDAPPPMLPRPPRRRGQLPQWGPRAVYGAAVGLAILLWLTAGQNVALMLVAAAIVGGVAVYAWTRSVEGPRHAKDRLVTLVVAAAFALAVIPLLSLIWTVVTRGGERFDLGFLTESMRNVVGQGGGAQHAIVGTLIITLVATLASVPIGILAAIYLQEYGRGRLAKALTFFVDVMTGIPSIVAGLFAFALFSILLGPGIRLGVMGSVALSILMIPIVVRSTEEMLRIVPSTLREASYALGVSKWRTIVKVVLPTAFVGIITGVMLAVARVVGETAPLLITTGVISTTNWNPFSGRMHNLPVFAYTQYKFPGTPPQPYWDRAWTAAATLILLVLFLYILARVIARRFGTETRR